MSRLNIPPLLEQYRENMLDKKTPENIRFNYRTNIENIRDFCNKALAEYEKQSKRR